MYLKHEQQQCLAGFEEIYLPQAHLQNQKEEIQQLNKCSYFKTDQLLKYMYRENQGHERGEPRVYRVEPFESRERKKNISTIISGNDQNKESKKYK